MTKVLIVFVSMAFLSACTKDHFIVVSFEDNQLRPCSIAQPPDRVAYSNADADTRAIMMTDSYITQIEYTTECNIRLNALREYNLKMKAKGVEE